VFGHATGRLMPWKDGNNTRRLSIILIVQLHFADTVLLVFCHMDYLTQLTISLVRHAWICLEHFIGGNNFFS